LAISLGPLASEQVIRLTGLTLQVLGIGTVAWGISETRALFGHPSFVSKTKAWFGRFPLLRSTHVLTATGVAALGLTGKARAHVTHRPTAPTIEARVEALENNVTSIHTRITETQNEMDDGLNKAAEALKRESQAREDEDKTIRHKLEATGTGGVHISAIGASWLFVGVVLSTASTEIAKITQ
jgi:hypothetical protein